MCVGPDDGVGSDLGIVPHRVLDGRTAANSAIDQPRVRADLGAVTDNG